VPRKFLRANSGQFVDNARVSAPPCTVCGPLPAEVTANTGRDERLPAAYRRLKKVASFGNPCVIYCCEACETHYEWEDLAQFYGSGNNDEERLTRLMPGATSVFRRL
jgi:hypothetical protein